MKFQKGQTIKFKYASVLTGVPLILTGKVLGFGDAVREMWPIECAECPDDMLLVRRQDNFGNTFHHAVHPDEIVRDDVLIVEKKA